MLKFLMMFYEAQMPNKKVKLKSSQATQTFSFYTSCTVSTLHLSLHKTHLKISHHLMSRGCSWSHNTHATTHAHTHIAAFLILQTLRHSIAHSPKYICHYTAYAYDYTLNSAAYIHDIMPASTQMLNNQDTVLLIVNLQTYTINCFELTRT